MRYITDIHALNIPCSLGTTGDWHIGALQWDHPRTLDTDKSPFGDWGIELSEQVPRHKGERLPIANHLRACADIIEQERFTVGRGMRRDFLDDDPKWDDELFRHIALLASRSNWAVTDKFMGREFGSRWRLSKCVVEPMISIVGYKTRFFIIFI